jgi:hypothetical protein
VFCRRFSNLLKYQAKGIIIEWWVLVLVGGINQEKGDDLELERTKIYG